MSKQKRHIDLLEELIRVISIKKRFNSNLMNSLIASVNKNYFPEKNKSDKLIEELEAYYVSKKPRRKFPLIIWVILAFVFFIGFLVLIPHKKVEQQDLKKQITIQQTISDSNTIDEIPENEVKKIDLFITGEKITKDTFVAEKTQTGTIQKDTATEEKPVVLIDTVPKNKLIPAFTPNKITDSVASLDYSNCLLPEFLIISFSKNSSDINDTYEIDLKEIAEKIIHCQNIEAIEIKTFYTRKFLIFSTKKLASERADKTIKTLKRNGVTIKMLRKTQTEYIQIKNSEYDESFEKIEIILDD